MVSKKQKVLKQFRYLLINFIFIFNFSLNASQLKKFQSFLKVPLKILQNTKCINIHIYLRLKLTHAKILHK